MCVPSTCCRGWITVAFGGQWPGQARPVGRQHCADARFVMLNSANADVSLDDLPGKNVIVGVPGAWVCCATEDPSYKLTLPCCSFTPICSSQVPEYISEIEKFQAKGIENVFVVSVNDAFVTKGTFAPLLARTHIRGEG